MPSWLIALIAVLVLILIIAIIYSIFVLRRIGIVAKKIDFLTEDLIYKSELLSSAVDSIVRVANLTDTFDAVINSKHDKLIEIYAKNKDVIKEITADINQVLNENEKVLIKDEKDTK